MGIGVAQLEPCDDEKKGISSERYSNMILGFMGVSDSKQDYTFQNYSIPTPITSYVMP